MCVFECVYEACLSIIDCSSLFMNYVAIFIPPVPIQYVGRVI